MTWQKCFFFNKILLHIYTFRLSKKLKHVPRLPEYQKDIQSKVAVGLAYKNLSYRHAEKESDWLIFHCKIEQTAKKAASKVVKRTFRELIM